MIFCSFHVVIIVWTSTNNTKATSPPERSATPRPGLLLLALGVGASVSSRASLGLSCDQRTPRQPDLLLVCVCGCVCAACDGVFWVEGSLPAACFSLIISATLSFSRIISALLLEFLFFCRGAKRPWLVTLSPHALKKRQAVRSRHGTISPVDSCRLHPDRAKGGSATYLRGLGLQVLFSRLLALVAAGHAGVLLRRRTGDIAGWRDSESWRALRLCCVARGVFVEW
jgi:hypothetical protein